MASFTERSEYNVEIIAPHNILQVRRADIIEKDGVQVGKTYHRHVVVPGDDVSGDCDQVKAVAAALWTPEVIKAYKASLPAEPAPAAPAP